MAPAALKNQVVKYASRIAFTGLVAVGAIAGGIRLSEFNSAGAPSPTTTTVIADYINGYVTATGSTTIKYPAACIANPLAAMGLGSGAVVRLTYSAGNNPAGVGGDIGFVKSCDNAGGSGATLIDNTCTSTGCLSTYTTGTALWNSADYIKFTPRGNLTSGYTGRIHIQYEDVFGE
jgi:hypothetical protein